MQNEKKRELLAQVVLYNPSQKKNKNKNKNKKALFLE